MHPTNSTEPVSSHIVTIAFTEADARAAISAFERLLSIHRTQFLRSRRKLVRIRWLCFLACTAFFVAMVVVASQSHDALSGRPYLLLLALVLAGLTGADLSNLYSGSFRRLTRSVRVYLRGLIGQAFQVSVQSTGVAIESAGARHQYEWNAIDDVAQADEMVCVFVGRTILFLPTRHFVNAENARRFVTDARAWLEAAGHGYGRYLKALLASRPCACPSCEYALEGTIDGRCPECGKLHSTMSAQREFWHRLSR